MDIMDISALHFQNFAVFLLRMRTKNILKIVTFVIEKMKLASFSLFLDASPPPPPRPKMPFEQLNVAIQIYNICNGVLGLVGERGCISERRH